MNLEIATYQTLSERLLGYAELNKDDNRFRVGGEIVYVLDTSVVESYWRREPPGGRYSTSELLDRDVAAFSGWLSLKFLMERRLPGQGTNGVFISPSHWNEALDRVARMSGDMRQDFRKAGNKDVATQASAGDAATVKALDASLKGLAGITDPKDLLREARRAGVGETFVQIMRAVSTQERVLRTFRHGRGGEPSIRDLTLCPLYSSLAESRVSFGDFKRWQGAIGRARRKLALERDSGAQDKEISRNVDNDATTMASIQAMYRGNPVTNGKKPTARIVFVTADAAIHDAYAELKERLEGEGTPFFLRHPDVYSPLLNHANMSRETTPENFAALKEVFDRVEEALEPLLDGYDLHSALAKGYERRLHYNIDIWSRNVLTLCLANSHYVVPDMEGDYLRLESLARILSAPDVREAAAASVSAEIGKIRDDHLQMMSLAAIEQLETARAKRAEQGEADHRAPVKLIGVDIAGGLGLQSAGSASSSVWLEDLLRDFRASQSSETPEQVVTRLREYWDHRDSAPAAQLLASCIFFAVNSWDNAQLCAQLCQRRIHRRRRSQTWAREARYCEALSIRMQLRSADDFRRAVGLLDRNIVDHVDPLAGMRDRVERATLRLTAIVIQLADARLPIDHQLGSFDFVPDEEIRSEFEGATSQLTSAAEALTDAKSFSDPDMAARIRVQAEINLLGATIFAHLLSTAVLFDESEPLSLSEARAALERVYSDTKLDASPSAQIYLVTCRALEDGGPNAAEAALADLAALSDGKHFLSDPDIIELRFFEMALRQQRDEAA